MEDKNICPLCRFPKRISGHVFINKNPIDYLFLKNARCKLCKHLPDYVIVNLNPLQATIIYRNFNNSKIYFNKVKKYLSENKIELIKEEKE